MVKKKKFLFGGLTALLGLTLAACGSGDTASSAESATASSNTDTSWSAIEEAGVIKVATSGTLYPSSFHAKENKDLTGYEVEVIREVAKRLGLEVEFIEMGVDGMLTAVKREAVDSGREWVSIGCR